MRFKVSFLGQIPSLETQSKPLRVVGEREFAGTNDLWYKLGVSTERICSNSGDSRSPVTVATPSFILSRSGDPLGVYWK